MLVFIPRLKAIKDLILLKLDTLLSQLTETKQLVKTSDITAKRAIKGNTAKLDKILTQLNQSHQAVHELAQSTQETTQSTALKLDTILAQLSESYQSVQELTQSAQETAEKNAALLQSTTHLLAGQQQLQAELQSLKQLHSARHQVIRTTDYQLVSPELGLMGYLYSYLPNRVALDIGANIGEVSEYLLHTGYEVYAFEPFPPVFDQLCARLKSYPNFHPYKLAIGSKDTVMDLHIASDFAETPKYDDATVYNSLLKHAMPADLQFTSTVPVPVRSLDSLHRSLEVPPTASVVKIDTEGFDLEVISGMGEYRYPVVLTEFWDREQMFGKTAAYNYLDESVKAMKHLGYHWHIVIYRINTHQTSFYCNYSQSIPNSWGNIVFFQDYNLFAQALKWCTAVMPVTHFDR